MHECLILISSNQKTIHAISNEEEDYNYPLSKFESMLKTKKYFFDSEEFEEIILLISDMGKA
jgi:hypothetical protein